VERLLIVARYTFALVALLATAIPTWADSTAPNTNVAALVSAAERGDDGEVRQLLAKGVDVNGRDQASTALTRAIVKHHIATVQLLLEAGANPNLPDISYTPLTDAATFSGVPEIVELLLKHQADPNLTFQGQTALCSLTWMARYSESTQVDIARLLLRGGTTASINQPCEADGGNTPLQSTIQWNKVALAKVLLEAGANPNEVMDRKSLTYGNGEVPLLDAVLEYAAFNDLSMTKLLLDFGADPNYRNNRMFLGDATTSNEDSWNGISPLIVVADSDYLPLVKLLLDRGANPCLHGWRVAI
jgi:ankyrin repeat protein